MVVDDILAIRERWHTKRHPFFGALGEGKLPLRVLGIYMAMHWQFVQRALASFGILFTRTFSQEDVRKMIVENLAEEEGLKAIPREGHELQIGRATSELQSRRDLVCRLL